MGNALGKTNNFVIGSLAYAHMTCYKEKLIIDPYTLHLSLSVMISWQWMKKLLPSHCQAHSASTTLCVKKNQVTKVVGSIPTWSYENRFRGFLTDCQATITVT